MFEDEDDLYDPLADYCPPASQDSSPPTSSQQDSSPSTSSQQTSSLSTSQDSSQPTPPPSQDSSLPLSQPSQASSQQPDTVSFACRPRELIPVREKKRPRKPSPVRQKRRTCDAVLDEFLQKGCGCASKCFRTIDEAYYRLMRDEANALTREALDMVIIGQIMAFTSFDVVVGPSHKHSPALRRRLRVKSFFHQ